jgi:isocitrate dehydrogenase
VEDQDDDQSEEPDKKEEDMLEKQQVNIDELDKTELVDNNDIKIKTQTKTPVKTSTQKTNKTRRKRLQEKITIDDDNYSPDTQSPDKIMEFENPNIQAYYETIPKSAKEEIAHLSVPEQKEEIKKQFNKISSKSS